jgi:hypothetical protein
MTMIPRTLLLLLILVSIANMAGLRPVRGDVQQPSYVVGDYWTYSSSSLASVASPVPGTGADFSIPVTYNLTVVDLETLTLNTTSYDVYREAITESSAYVFWHLSGLSFARQSDLGLLEQYTDVSFPLMQRQSVNSTYSPALSNLEFPLYVGKTWSQTVTSHSTATIQYPLGQGKTVQYFNTTTTTYSVVSLQLTTVTAGTYDTYLVRSSSTSGSTETYYSPEAEQIVEEINYDSTGAVVSTTTLQSFDAWPYSTSFQASHAGASYALIIRTDVPATQIAQDATAITFQVSGNDTVTGRADVTFPIMFNSTIIGIKVDGTNVTSASILKDSVNYYLFFTFPLSTHTISITYAKVPAFSSLVILAIVGTVAAVVIIAAVLILFGRRRSPTTSRLSDPDAVGASLVQSCK